MARHKIRDHKRYIVRACIVVGVAGIGSIGGNTVTKIPQVRKAYAR